MSQKISEQDLLEAERMRESMRSIIDTFTASSLCGWQCCAECESLAKCVKALRCPRGHTLVWTRAPATLRGEKP